MSAIIENASLLHYNTFGIDAKTRFLYPLYAAEAVTKALAFAAEQQLPWRILGGGSNILLSGDYAGVTLIPMFNAHGVEQTLPNNEVIYSADAGVNWHELVMNTLQQGWNGLENLALIPGTVGAAPIQNIGAYGIEVCERIAYVYGYHISSQTWEKLPASACNFGYRTSLFKTDWRNDFIITRVGFKLKSTFDLRLKYGAIQDQLNAMGVATPTPLTVSQAVIAIRNSKLPDPKTIGNCGSFFKNPEIPNAKATALKAQFEKMPVFTTDHGLTKLSAAWLIEQVGWKGKYIGNVGTYDKHALVLINRGGASGAEAITVANAIIAAVSNKFDVRLEPEVNLW